jgi:very-short-patch-repair endonuclease
MRDGLASLQPTRNPSPSMGEGQGWGCVRDVGAKGASGRGRQRTRRAIENPSPSMGEGQGWGCVPGVGTKGASGRGRNPAMTSPSHHAKGAISRARSLRRAMTVGERRLWTELRRLKLNIRRQVPIGRYIADFASHGPPLVIEVDGVHHELPSAQLRDLDRTAWLKGQGYEVLRFREDEVRDDPAAVASKIATVLIGLRLISRRSAPPAASPSSPAHTPPSPTLPPSRGKGDVNSAPSQFQGKAE